MTIQPTKPTTPILPRARNAAPAIHPARATAGAAQWLTVGERALLADFWQRARVQLAYPRALDRVISIALPAFIVRIPRLRPRYADDWLRARGRNSPLASAAAGESASAAERPLHGCYMGQNGYGFIFVDGTDSDDEVRFTLAHETAHFLLDYLQPREQAIARFGKEILPVLDGERLPTLRERFRAIGAQLPIGNRINLMQRNLAGSDALELVDTEDRADRFAFALLAPPEEVLAATLDAPHAEQLAHLHALLMQQYGLPAQPAARYAQSLLACIGSEAASWQELPAQLARQNVTSAP